MFPESLDTPRLRHERLGHDTVDLQELYRICAEDDGIDEVTEYMLWSPHRTIKETKDFLDRAEERWAAGESAKYVIRPREGEDDAGEIAGLTGLKLDWERRTAEEWIWLRKRFWGRGYNRESALRLMEVVFEDLDLEVYAVQHAADNERSRRAVESYIEAAGGRREGRLRNWVPHGAHVADEVRYTVTKAEWDASEVSLASD